MKFDTKNLETNIADIVKACFPQALEVGTRYQFKIDIYPISEDEAVFDEISLKEKK